MLYDLYKGAYSHGTKFFLTENEAIKYCDEHKLSYIQRP